VLVFVFFLFSSPSASSASSTLNLCVGGRRFPILYTYTILSPLSLRVPASNTYSISYHSSYTSDPHTKRRKHRISIRSRTRRYSPPRVHCVLRVHGHVGSLQPLWLPLPSIYITAVSNASRLDKSSGPGRGLTKSKTSQIQPTITTAGHIPSFLRSPSFSCQL